MTVRSAAELARVLLGFHLDPLPLGAWMPPPGTAALEFITRGARTRPTAAIVSPDGAYAFTVGRYQLAVDLWALARPEPIAWVRKEWYPAQAAIVAAFGVTASPTLLAQRVLADVRARGVRIEGFVAANVCRTCVPGLAETNHIEAPEASTLELLHEPGCPRGGA